MKKTLLILAATVLGLSFLGYGAYHLYEQREAALQEARILKEREVARAAAAEGERKTQEAREKAEKARKVAEEEHQKKLAEMRKLAEEDELRRKEKEMEDRHKREIAELQTKLKKQEEQENTQKRLEDYKEKMRTPAITLKFNFGKLSGEELIVALVHSGDKVTVRIQEEGRSSYGYGDQLYVRLAQVNSAYTPKSITEVTLLNLQDSFTISKNLNKESRESMELLATEEGGLLMIGSKTNWGWGRRDSRQNYNVHVEIFEGNQWGIKPKSLLPK